MGLFVAAPYGGYKTRGVGVLGTLCHECFGYLLRKIYIFVKMVAGTLYYRHAISLHTKLFMCLPYEITNCIILKNIFFLSKLRILKRVIIKVYELFELQNPIMRITTYISKYNFNIFNSKMCSEIVLTGSLCHIIGAVVTTACIKSIVV